MDNFNLKKYLAEGKLHEEEMDLSYTELTDDEKDDVSDMMDVIYTKINPEGGMKKNTGLFRFIDAWFESKGDSLSENKLIKEDAGSILDLLRKNQKEIASKTMNPEYFPFDEVSLDSLDDASITLKDEAGGLSFRYPEDVDSDFVGQDGDEPRPITIGGVDLMYIGYNI